jgi:GrpB-like predicted nucleotidyltransferase (UPF0157 family)
VYADRRLFGVFLARGAPEDARIAANGWLLRPILGTSKGLAIFQPSATIPAVNQPKERIRQKAPNSIGNNRRFMPLPPRCMLQRFTAREAGDCSMKRIMVGPYVKGPAIYREYDPLAPEAARALCEAIENEEPRLTVEHIGSTAAPGCAGKGIIDLMVLYPPGLLAPAKEALDRLGFQRQTTRDPFPEDRPMRVGAVEHGGAQFRVHAHVISVDSAEAGELRAFRDRLRAEPALRAEYEALKRSILAAGIVDSVDYAEAKSAFIRGNI